MKIQDIKVNLIKLNNEINEFKEKLNIKRKIVLIAVSKTFPAEDIISAYNCGQLEFGENKIQESVEKIKKVNEYISDKENKITWHFIGHLQSNKVKLAVEYYDVIHSIDKLSRAKIVSKRAKEINKQIDILIQVNTTSEESKSGCKPEEALALSKSCLDLENINLKGFMTISKFGVSDIEIGKSFSMLRNLKESISKELNSKLEYLSMGMSGDWKIALSEGATHLRVGTAIFGRRACSL